MAAVVTGVEGLRTLEVLKSAAGPRWRATVNLTRARERAVGNACPRGQRDESDTPSFISMNMAGLAHFAWRSGSQGRTWQSCRLIYQVHTKIRP